MKIRTILAAIFGMGLLAACSQGDARLEGERLTPRGDAVVERATQLLPENPPALNLVKSRANTAWPQRNGSPQHVIPHPSLPAQISTLWLADIGAGNGRRHRITAEPIIGGNRVYTMDSRALLRAHDLNGQFLWERDLTPGEFDNGDASGGAISYHDGGVFAVTGFGQIHALDAETGRTIWEQDLGSFAGAPTIYKGLVYLSARDGSAWALERDTGLIAWQLAGVRNGATGIGGPAPAVNNKYVFFPFGSGEILATFRRGGFRNWSTVLSGQRAGFAAGEITDISGDPIVEGGTIYAANRSGRIGAFSVETGARIWTAKEGAQGTLWSAGNSLFFVNDQNVLMRLSKATGDIIWRQPLPHFVERRFGRSKEIHRNFGPVLAGGRLYVSGSDAKLRIFDPVSGVAQGAIDLPSGAAANPVVAQQMLFIPLGDGRLIALR